jgi:hypothetical protein
MNITKNSNRDIMCLIGYAYENNVHHIMEVLLSLADHIIDHKSIHKLMKEIDKFLEATQEIA